MVLPMIDLNERASLQRPAWTSTDFYAYQHKYLRDRKIRGHFVRTRGFDTINDLHTSRRKV